MTKQCRCGGAIEYEPEFIIGGMEPTLCDSCISKESSVLRINAQSAQLRSRWLAICPETFRDTLIERLPCREKSELALEWRPHGSGRGLNLYGKPGIGKTRTLYLVLERVHFNDNLRVKMIVPHGFSHECEVRAFKRAPWLQMLRTVDVLAFDDIDKMTLTRDKESDLFGVIDWRTAHRKPCLFTGNSTGDQLKLRFKNGEALVRRIRQFCTSIYFDER